MRKNFGPQSWLFPMPVLIVGTFDEENRPDAMNAAWGGIHDTNQIAVCIAPEHKTAKNLLLKKAFTVAFADAANVSGCDYVGLVSGNSEKHKLEKAGFHAEKAAFVDAPLIRELPVSLECRLVSFDEKTGCTVGEIVNVCADEKILGADGKIDAEKAGFIAFDPVCHVYRRIGGVAGKAFEIGAALK
ncbi:MAG: flavin reductase [Victivallaceae bacterium]|nr:flavin reductase [Victivallaceae bacterium]